MNTKNIQIILLLSVFFMACNEWTLDEKCMDVPNGFISSLSTGNNKIYKLANGSTLDNSLANWSILNSNGTTKISFSTASSTLTLDSKIIAPDGNYILQATGKNSCGLSFTIQLPISVLNTPNIDMVFVEGGAFQMGTNTGYNADKPIHTVTLSSFYIGKYEVTQAQYKAVMGSNPSYFTNCDNCPVDNISWDDTQTFLTKLNTMSGKTYRLPTEAEWEYAGRGGKRSQNYTYAGSNTIGDVAWYKDNSESKPHEVGKKQANELGLYDMSGNIGEWCQDWYQAYTSDSQINPKGATTGTSKIIRGGNFFYSNIVSNATTSRNWIEKYTTKYYNYGFRLVRTN